jgi:hypothetical protein
MWEVMSYRFLCVSMVLQLYYYNFTWSLWTNPVARHSYHSKYDHKRSCGSSSRYMYHCAQIDDRQHASKKSQMPSVKHRDKESMQTLVAGLEVRCASSPGMFFSFFYIYYLFVCKLKIHDRERDEGWQWRKGPKRSI